MDSAYLTCLTASAIPEELLSLTHMCTKRARIFKMLLLVLACSLYFDVKYLAHPGNDSV